MKILRTQLIGWASWHMPVIPQVFRRRREEDRDSRAVWAKV
jgi:hypothetical protein